MLTALSALSPLDGRYRHQLEGLAAFFSEEALIRYRARVEIEYLIALAALNLKPLQALPAEACTELRLVYENLGEAELLRVKALERTTNHDVKALEYFLKERLASLPVFIANPNLLEFIHFGLTSQDVNNTALPLALKEAITHQYLPRAEKVIATLADKATTWAAVPMLARTHGQAASPTTLGKEIRVFVERLERQLAALGALPYPAKFGGATGNLNAHVVAYPAVDWPAFADQFVNKTLGLSRTRTTTQVEPYDGLAAIFDNLRRINVVLLDLCRDLWAYVSLGYFGQAVEAGEVGSSAMPHKVNPIDFENSEGNLGLANALFDHMANKLPVSRLQRDLSDSTVLRNVGVPLGHTLLALNSILKGFTKLQLHPERLHADLAANWAVVAEALQTILRREGYPTPYEALKALTRGTGAVTEQTIQDFINSLAVPEAVKAELHQVTPFNYLGTAARV